MLKKVKEKIQKLNKTNSQFSDRSQEFLPGGEKTFTKDSVWIIFAQAYMFCMFVGERKYKSTFVI